MYGKPCPYRGTRHRCEVRRPRLSASVPGAARKVLTETMCTSRSVQRQRDRIIEYRTKCAQRVTRQPPRTAYRKGLTQPYYTQRNFFEAQPSGHVAIPGARLSLSYSLHRSRTRRLLEPSAAQRGALKQDFRRSGHPTLSTSSCRNKSRCRCVDSQHAWFEATSQKT